MNPVSYPLLISCLISSLLLVSNIASALPDDRNQPINVSADTARKNGNQGLTLYAGNVVITQGSIRITGDEVAIYDTAGTVSKMIAKGNTNALAEFKQRPQPEGSDLIANGETIEYNVDNETLLLLENARLEDGGDTTESNKIAYDMKSTVVNAGDDNGRVIMILQPPKK
jgi:lipopolysaccharide export system protein LptA